MNKVCNDILLYIKPFYNRLFIYSCLSLRIKTVGVKSRLSENRTRLIRHISNFRSKNILFAQIIHVTSLSSSRPVHLLPALTY